MRGRIWLITSMILVCLVQTDAEPFRVVKVWKFTLPHGTLQVYLRSFPDGSSSLGIGPVGQLRAAPLSEQIAPLKQVLEEMPKLGIPPQTLSYLGTRLFEEDVLQKLAYACVDSKAWRSSMQNKGKRKEKLVVVLLNESGAYQPYNDVFKDFGMRMRVSEAEQVGLMPFSQIPPRGSRDRRDAKLPVPADAILGMRFTQVALPQR